jgi:hypothetical protein
MPLKTMTVAAVAALLRLASPRRLQRFWLL